MRRHTKLIAGFSASFLGIVLLSFAFSSLRGNLNNFNISVNLPRAYVVQSASMEPAIKLGSVVLVGKSANYLGGDIVSFAPNGDTKTLVTHRIVFKTYPDGIYNEPVYLTAGDANEDFDRWEVRNEQITGKVLFSVPFLGYFVNFAKIPQGFILLVIIPATIVIWEEFKSIRRELGRFFARFKTQEGVEGGLPRIAILLPIFGATLVFVAVTGSYFLDSELSVNNILGAATHFSHHEPLSEILESPTPTPTPEPTLTPEPTPSPTPEP